MNRFVARPWLVMAVIFVLGMGTGALLTMGLAHRMTGAAGTQDMGNRWMTHLTHRLNLTEDQQAKIRPIVLQAGEQIQSAHHEDIDRISSIVQAADANISKLLQPDQQAELKKMEKDRERFFPGRHGPGTHWPESGRTGSGGPPDHPPSAAP